MESRIKEFTPHCIGRPLGYRALSYHIAFAGYLADHPCAAAALHQTLLTASQPHILNLDLSCAPYVSYGVKYIDPVSPTPDAPHGQPITIFYITPLFFKMAASKIWI